LGQSSVHDIQLSQTPLVLLRGGDQGTSTVADSSGNGLDFASSTPTVAAPTMLFAPKNPGGGASSIGPGRSLQRSAVPSAVRSLAISGAELELFFTSTDASSGACIFDCRRTDGAGGLAIIANSSSSSGASSPSWLTIRATDNASPPQTSYLDFYDPTLPFWRDGLKHKLTVRFRMSPTPFAPAEIFEAELDGIRLIPEASSLNQAGSTGGTFVDHTDPIRIGSAFTADHPWTGSIQQFAWFPRTRARAESKAVWGAACYDIGDGIGCGLNGVIHLDANGSVSRTPNLTTLASPGMSVAAVPNRFDLARGGNGSAGAAVNTLGDPTRPTLVTDPRGWRALYFDNLNQSQSNQRQSLSFSSFPGAQFSTAQTSISAVVASRSGSHFAVSMRTIARLLGPGNDLRLAVHADRPQVQMNRSDIGTSDPSAPVIPCVPGPGVVSLSVGARSGVPYGTLACAGVSSPLASSLALGSYSTPFTSGGTLGCCDGDYNGFDGLMYEVLIESCAHDDADQAARNTWLAHKWGIDRQDARLIIGCTSIEVGTPANSEAIHTSSSTLGWAGFLSPALQTRVSCFNAAIGGSQSGRLFTTDGTATPYPDNSNFPATERGYGSPAWYSATGAPPVPGRTIAVLEPFTNSVERSVTQHGGEDVSAQCIAHLQTLVSQINSAAPGTPIVLLMYPTTSSFSSSNSATGRAITTWVSDHASQFAAVITPNPLPSGQWIHPTGGLAGSGTNDYLYLAGLIENAISPLLPTQLGTCCDQSIACTPTAASNCPATSVWTPGATCSPNPCLPPPDGACCEITTLSCTMLQQTACTSGNWINGSCSATPCLLGACCTGPHCRLATMEACGAATFFGASTVCGTPGNPTLCCRANFNNINGVEVQDLFAFLAAWFAGSPTADFNGGGIGVGDIFDFITAWFTGC
jgi:hypothetical protein